MRASRLLSLLLMLQNRGPMTAPALAAELEVSVRTVYRDVESLGAAGVPIYAERGARGGYRLLDGYRTRLTGMTLDEAESLFFAGLPGPAAELGLGGALAAAQLKLAAALPPDLRERAAQVAERFHLDAPGWFRDAEDTPALADVAAAVWQGRRLEVRYRRWNGVEVDRSLDPLGLVLKAGVWYLVAARADADGPRTYRVGRVLSWRSVDEPSVRPDAFDLADFWRSRSEQLRAALWRGTAEVRLSPRGQTLVPVLLGAVEARALADSAGPPDEEGWVRATLPIESLRHAESNFLRLGAEVEVLAPPELRAQLATTVRALAARYA